MPIFLTIMSIVFTLMAFLFEGATGIVSIVVATMLVCTAILSTELRKLDPFGAEESDEP